MSVKITSNKYHQPIILLFDRCSDKKYQVTKLISEIGYRIHGVLCEEEGIQFLKETPRVDLVIIDSAYNCEQRKRIKEFIADHDSRTKITEPGMEYTYSNDNIKSNIKNKLGL